MPRSEFEAPLSDSDAQRRQPAAPATAADPVADVTGPTGGSIDFAALFDGLPTAYLIMDRDLVIVGANAAYLALLGRTSEQLIGRPVFEAFPPEPENLDDNGQSQLELSFLRARDTGHPDVMPLYQYDVLDSDTGTLVQRFWSLISAPLIGSDGSTQFVLQRVEDVSDYVRDRANRGLQSGDDRNWSERLQAAEAQLFVRIQQVAVAREAEKMAVEALRVSEERARAVLDTAVDAIISFDRVGTVESLNRAAELMFGYRSGDAVGRPVSLLMPTRTDVKGDVDLPTDHQTGSAVRAGQDVLGIRSDGTAFPIELAISEAGVGSGLFTAIVRDISERKRLEDQLAHQSVHDPLTGLANRTLLLDRLEHAVARLTRHPGVLAVLFIDLDRFKKVNDTLGHSAGDELLVHIADELRRLVRTEDLVARFGGDEFVVLCEELRDPSEAEIVASRISVALRRPVVIHGRQLTPGASVGVVADQGGRTATDLLRDADAAMYEAKRQGSGMSVAS